MYLGRAADESEEVHKLLSGEARTAGVSISPAQGEDTLEPSFRSGQGQTLPCEPRGASGQLCGDQQTSSRLTEISANVPIADIPLGSIINLRLLT